VELVAVPLGVVTLIEPEVVPAGTTATRCVGDETVVELAAVPLKETLVEPTTKFVPLTVTLVPAAPLTGVKDVMVGGAMNVNAVALVPVPAAVVTVIGPELAVAGTVAVIWVGESTV